MAKSLVERLRSGQREEFPLGGVLQDARCLEAAEEIERLRALITEAIPFIGYQAHVPDLLERAEAAVNYGSDMEKSAGR